MCEYYLEVLVVYCLAYFTCVCPTQSSVRENFEKIAKIVTSPLLIGYS
jgi:hypothetical protein